MKINNLATNQLNQNGYNKNRLTKERIGSLFTYPTDYTPEDCLACDGYLVSIADYKDLYAVIGKKFNKKDDATGSFRIPDYNITGRFLQPSSKPGELIAAGLPNITATTDVGGVGSKPIYIGNPKGAFYSVSTGSIMTRSENTSNKPYGLGFNASRSNAIYGASSTVQPPAQGVHICIKYK